MSEVAYVCLSDLHFGAASSLLTTLNYDTLKVEPQSAPQVLGALVECLAAILPDGPKPVLVLNGDIFELALADDHDAVMAFERFVQLAIKEKNLFSRVVFLPGNHDHHLWETAREAQYQYYLEHLPPEDPPEPPWHTTPLCGPIAAEGPLTSPLLQAIFRRRGVTTPLEVRYPNFGLFGNDGQRAVVFHHGHFIEPIYRAMTVAQDAILGKSDHNTVEDWEARNFAWIDFVWSTLGRSGDVGDHVAYIYDMLEDREAVRLMADRLLVVTLPLAVKNRLARWLARIYLRGRIAAAVGGLERRNPSAPLSPSGRKGLHAYLDGPVAAQLRKAQAEAEDGAANNTFEDMTLVFGHTHKPFQEHWAGCTRYPNGVSLFNTGGWVIDSTKADVRQGAAVILIDNELHPVSLHIYQQTPDGPMPHVTVEALNPNTNPLWKELEANVHAGDPPWNDLTGAIAADVPRRRMALERLIANGIQALKHRGGRR